MNLLNQLKSWYYTRQCQRYSRKAKQAHVDMREAMTPYMIRIEHCDKMARNARIKAAMALKQTINDDMPEETARAYNDAIVQQ